MLYLPGISQEPTVNIAKQAFCGFVMCHLKHCWPPQNTVKQAVFAA